MEKEKVARTRKFPKEFLIRLLREEIEEEEARIISDKVSGNYRWSVHHDLIFETGGSFYSSDYSVGATELQCESPYEYDDDEIECTEVHPVEVTTVVYKTVWIEE